MRKKKKQIEMIKIREILRLTEQGRSIQETALSCNVTKSTVSTYRKLAHQKGVKVADLEGLTDEAIYQLLGKNPLQSRSNAKSTLDFEHIHKELQRPNVTLQLLWEEYRAGEPEGYQYSRYCELYRLWCAKHKVTMRQTHTPGEVLQVDYAGDKVEIIDRETGEVTEASIFVATFPASGHTYAEATADETLASWLGSHVRALAYFGGAPKMLSPDNLRTGVTKSCFYDPVINRAYQEFSEHYGIAVVPTRKRKPRDKASVENGVQNVGRRLLAPLRNQQFFSRGELNKALMAGLYEYVRRPMQEYKQSRLERFESFEKDSLIPLPATPYVYASWKEATVNIDYHVQFDDHYYSVPYHYVRQGVLVRATEQCVEIFHKGSRIAVHVRGTLAFKHTTLKEHMPSHHRFREEWSQERFLKWAEGIGPNTKAFVELLFASRQVPEQAIRSCLGVLNLPKKYSSERLEQACGIAVQHRIASFQRLRRLLEKGVDLKSQSNDSDVSPLQHDNIRGGSYFH